ncbi:hypothetical protein ABEW32_04955 [Paenibacillus jamilae]|uniref:hypothetical protein n=1 Tax=Paenibacillus jamilae TaxID=114136 RepID=UPI003D2DD8D7
MDVKHIVMYSGGIGSWATARRVAEQHGTGNLILLFTDTSIEDRDLYRFLIETSADIFGIDIPRELVARCDGIPDISTEEDIRLRKILLPQIAAETMYRIPGVKWIADGRAPWDVFRHKKYIGNSRRAQCSHVLKQEPADRWVRSVFDNERGAVIYLGIDWTEVHRTEAPIKNWSPYRVEFPMCDEPYLDKEDMLKVLDQVGIQRPRLYEMGFSHNNCSGLCVRAGQGHWARVLDKLPAQYAYQERKEQEMREFIGKNVSMLKQVRGRTTYSLTLAELRKRIEEGAEIDVMDIGGCGCFVTDSETAA